MSEYYVDPQARIAHEQARQNMLWGYVNTASPDYPDMVAIRRQYPSISASDAAAMIARNRSPQRLSTAVSQTKRGKNANGKETQG